MPSVESAESEEERQIREAIRLSLLEEEQRKKQPPEDMQGDDDDWELKEAIRLSLESEQQNKPSQGSTPLPPTRTFSYLGTPGFTIKAPKQFKH